MRDLHTAGSVLSSRMADRSCLEVAVDDMPRGGSRGATVGENTSLIFDTATTPMTAALVLCCTLYLVPCTSYARNILPTVPAVLPCKICLRKVSFSRVLSPEIIYW